jgi:hypothetical protein
VALSEPVGLPAGCRPVAVAVADDFLPVAPRPTTTAIATIAATTPATTQVLRSLDDFGVGAGSTGGGDEGEGLGPWGTWSDITVLLWAVVGWRMAIIRPVPQNLLGAD